MQYLEYNDEKKYFEYTIDSDNNKSFTLKFPYHLPTAITPVEISPSGVSEYEFVLVKGLGFEGVVLNANGQKIVDAIIGIEPIQNDNNRSSWSSSDEYGNSISSTNSSHMIQNLNGKFFAYGYTAGKHQIKVSHYDYIAYIEEVELSNKSILDMQIILKSGSKISGTVSNSKGRLVVNAKMNLVLQPSGKVINGTSYQNTGDTYYAGTDSKGQFIFKSIPMGTYQLYVKGSSGHLENYEIVVNESQDITNLNIKLEDNLEISGMVVDEKGNPLKNIWVYINQADNNQRANEGQHTDATGEFKFTNIFNKKYAFKIYSQDGYKLDPVISVMGGDTNVKLILKSPIKMLITGHVYMPDGKECSSYSLTYIDIEKKFQGVFIDPKISSTGFQGSINIENLQTIKVIATAVGFSSGESTSFNLPQYAGQPILINLKNKIDLELRVIDLYTRNPISQADASLAKDKNFWYDIPSNVQSDDKGQVVLFASSVGKFTLTVRVAGYVNNSMEIEVLEKNSPIEILMGKGGVIKGQILDTENNLIPFISVSAFPLQNNNNDHRQYFDQQIRNIFKATTDENGYFEIKLVPPGKYYLRTESVSKIQVRGLFRGLPINIEEGKEINISRNEMMSISKMAKVNIALTGVDINKKEIILAYTKPIREDQNIESVSMTSNDEGKVRYPSVPHGEFIITVNGFSKPITMPLLIDSDKEINLVIPVE
jgi:protocatechuate 3,4-dioxygenase beta subunit